MQIRKLFKFEMAHIVRKAFSTRCAKNIHWHSYLLEVFLEGKELDEAGMVLDFGLVKKEVNDFIDSFDHTLCIWNLPEEKALVEFATKNFERVIVLPFNSTAEMQAKMFYELISKLLSKYTIKVSKCIVHETTTGYAEYMPVLHEDMPKTLYPIRIFEQKDADTVISEKDYIWISEWISNERKEKMWVLDYNENFTM